MREERGWSWESSFSSWTEEEQDEAEAMLKLLEIGIDPVVKDDGRAVDLPGERRVIDLEPAKVARGLVADLLERACQGLVDEEEARSK